MHHNLLFTIMKNKLLLGLLLFLFTQTSCNKNINRNVEKAIRTEDNEAWVLTEGGQIKDFQFQTSIGPHYNGNIISFAYESSGPSMQDMAICPTSNDSVKSKIRFVLNDEKDNKENRFGYLTITSDSVKFLNGDGNSKTQHFIINVVKLNKKEFQFSFYSDDDEYLGKSGFYSFEKREI